MRPTASATLPRIGLTALLALTGLGCRSEMYDQPRYEPYEASETFADGLSSRPLVAGTVPRGELAIEARYAVTRDDKGLEIDAFPYPVDRSVMERGRERYQIYCYPCHGAGGDGNGMIVKRGFNPPPSFHSEAVRKLPVGHYVEVIGKGHGTMYSYDARVNPRDRWAIAAYIRVLQFSRDRPLAELPTEDRSWLQNPPGGASK